MCHLVVTLSFSMVEGRLRYRDEDRHVVRQGSVYSSSVHEFTAADRFWKPVLRVPTLGLHPPSSPLLPDERIIAALPPVF